MRPHLHAMRGFIRDALGCTRGRQSGAIRRHQAPSGAIRRHQVQSGAIRRHQAPSGAIRCHQAPSGAIRCNRVQSGAIGCNQAPSGRVLYRRGGSSAACNQASSGAIRCNQVSSTGGEGRVQRGDVAHKLAREDERHVCKHAEERVVLLRLGHGGHLVGEAPEQ